MSILKGKLQAFQSRIDRKTDVFRRPSDCDVASNMRQ